MVLINAIHSNNAMMGINITKERINNAREEM